MIPFRRSKQASLVPFQEKSLAWNNLFALNLCQNSFKGEVSNWPKSVSTSVMAPAGFTLLGSFHQLISVSYISLVGSIIVNSRWLFYEFLCVHSFLFTLNVKPPAFDAGHVLKVTNFIAKIINGTSLCKFPQVISRSCLGWETFSMASANRFCLANYFLWNSLPG